MRWSRQTSDFIDIKIYSLKFYKKSSLYIRFVEQNLLLLLLLPFGSVCFRFRFFCCYFILSFWLIAVGHWTIFGHLATHSTHLRIFVKIQIEASCKTALTSSKQRILRDLCKLAASGCQTVVSCSQWLSNCVLNIKSHHGLVSRRGWGGADVLTGPVSETRQRELDCWAAGGGACCMGQEKRGGANHCITNFASLSLSFFFSLFLQTVPINVTLQRKKSMPDFQELPRATEAMSREEVSALGSARREAVRRQIEVNERLKANPLLYLVSPQVKVSEQ